MNVQSIGLNALGGVSQIVGNPPTPRPPPGSVDAQSASTTQLSGGGQFLSKLADLEKSDPSKAKAILTQIANSLTQQASQATGTTAEQLSQTAAKFQQAANTGDLSGLQPAAAHHRGRAQRAYTQSQNSAQNHSLLVALTQNSGAIAPR
jgi:hypothetical protein